MSRRRMLASAVSLALALCTQSASAKCVLARLAELPVSMVGLRPVVAAKINGTAATFIVDSGAFFSTITPAGASRYRLRLKPAPYGLRVSGVGGSSDAQVTSVGVFTLGAATLHNLQFIVAGGEVGVEAAGVLGQNILQLADTEYDLANGIVRLWRPRGCRHSVLAYWASAEPYSVVDIRQDVSIGGAFMIATARLNGVAIRVMFDSGSGDSLVTLRAAKRAGFRPDGSGVRQGGLVRGVGEHPVPSWIAPFASFTIGGEQIRHTQLRVANFYFGGVDMLLGADFFLSHRIYVALSQRKLYFSYNGGPVFKLPAPQPLRTAPPLPPGTAPQASLPPSLAAASAAQRAAAAAAFSRRGAALLARRNYTAAIADLDRACQLAPRTALYFFERGQAWLLDRQPAQAMADFDTTLALSPRNVPARVARAGLRLAGHDVAGATADLDAADRFAAPQDDARLELASLYLSAGRFARAVAQFDLWIDHHPSDSHKAAALNGRCWTRALWEHDLRKALRDCNEAVRLRKDSASFLDSRAFVEQRLGRLDRAIGDYDAALRLAPRNAWLRYSRGVAEIHAGHTAAGRADIAAATALAPRIAALGRVRRLTP
ncbi:MAG: aspartyl protease family protein [Steroidobacteraceae bacterium]